METPLLTIDYRNFILGESSADRVPDRGFSPKSYGLNLTREKGTLYFSETATNRAGAVLVAPVIASTHDPSFLGNDSYHLDSSGNFYTLDGSTLTKRQTDGTKTYTLGTSEIITHKGSTFATSTTDVALLTGSDLTTLDNDWWTATRGHGALDGNYRHPMEVVEDTLYIADKNAIHTWDGTTSVEDAMLLPDGINITTLRKHPDGRHLIAFCGVTANFSHTRNGGGKIYVIDTVTLEFIREIETDVQVEGSRNAGGVIYVTYAAKCGYFDGDGIQWIRDLAAGSVTYSHNLGALEDFLLVRDGQYVLAYGDLGGGGKVWWKLHKASNIASAGVITNIQYKGDNKLLVSYADGSANPVLEEIDYDNGGIIGSFYSNRVPLGQRVAIRRIEIEHTQTGNPATNGFGIILYDAVDSTIANAAPSYVNNPQSETRIDLDAFATDIQLNLYPSNGAMGFRRIRIYGESIE